MTDFATLGIKVDSSDAKTAAVDLANLATAGTRAETQTKKVGTAMQMATVSAAQNRAGFQQLGFQLGDFTTQVSSGTSVTQALVQQLGQTTQALQLMGGGRGALGAVAGFLGGPWGIALSVGAIALSGLIGKLFDAGDAADKAGTKFASAADQARKLAGAANALELNDRKIKFNRLTEEQFRLEKLRINSPFAGDPNAGFFSGGSRLGGARRRLDEIRQEKLEAANLIKLAEQQNTALEKSAAISAIRTRATGAATTAQRSHTGAIGAAQKAQAAALKTTDDYISRLEEEIAKMGKTEQQLRAMEIARAREGAATQAQRQRIDELNAAREREIGKAKISVAVLADLAERRKFFEDSFDGAVEQASKNREDALRREQDAAEGYANSLRDLVGLLDQIGGKTGRALSDIAAIFTGLTTGDFRGVRGPVGAAIGILANTQVGKKEDGSIKTLGDRIVEIFDSNGKFAKTFKGLLEGAGTGAAIGGVLFGKNNKAAQIGGAIGGAIGKQLGGPVGELIGSALGSAVGSTFKKDKTGSATLGFSANGDLGVTGTGGNSGSRKTAASGLASGVGGALDQIAERLGGTVDGPISVSIGVRNKNFKVDPTGKGRTKGAGVLDFGKDEAAALRGAIAEALKDGVIQGISAGAQKLLASGDVEKQLAKAVKFQSVFDQLKERTDPLGFAMEQLGREAESLKKIFGEAGASAQDYAKLEQLLALKREDAAKDAGGAANALKAFLLDLNAGPGSPLSLRQQKVEAEAALSPFSAAIASAQAARAQADAIKASGGSATAIGAAEQAARLAAGKIDQDGFQSAAQRLLGISRAGDASGSGFFAEFDRIRALTQTGIGLIDRPVDLTPQIAQNTADTANLLVDNNELLKSIDARLSLLNDNGVLTGDWFAGNRSFVA